MGANFIYNVLEIEILFSWINQVYLFRNSLFFPFEQYALNSTKIQHTTQFQIEVQSSLQKTNYKRERLSFIAKSIRKVIQINS